MDRTSLVRLYPSPGLGRWDTGTRLLDWRCPKTKEQPLYPDTPSKWTRTGSTSDSYDKDPVTDDLGIENKN